MKTVSNYYKQVLAFFKGDVDTVIAAQNERKANAAFKGQIAALGSQLVDDENTVEDKRELYNAALYPTTKIIDGKDYVRRVVYAKEALEAAEATLQATKDSLKFFEELVAKEWAMVDAE